MEKQEMYDKVSSVIDNLRPYLQADGGDIELKNITDDNVVEVKLQGACGSCPFKIHTLKNGVEQAIKKELPDIKEVISIDD